MTASPFTHEAPAVLSLERLSVFFDGATLYAANLGRWHITCIDTDTSAPPLAAMVGVRMEEGEPS